MQNLENLKKHYDKVGWVVHKKLFDENQISIVKKLIDGFLSSQLKRYSSKTKSLNFVNDSDTTDLNNINSFHELADCEEIKKLANSDNILKTAKFFLNSDPEFRFCELFAKPPKKGLPSPDHQDNFYWGVKGSNALTFWIALDKSTKENGAIHYYDGSHKYGVLKHEASFAKGSSQKISDKSFLKKFNKSQPNLEPGDALIHHSLVVHGSSKNLSKNSRRGWTIQFKDKLASYDLKKIELYQRSLKKQIEARS